MKKRFLRSKLPVVVTVVVFGLLGVLFLTTSQAATSAVASEAETGTFGGSASRLDGQTGASGSATVRFGSTGGGGAGCSQANIQTLVNSVSQANIEANLRSLVQDDSKPTPNQLISRHVSAPGNAIKVAWMKQKLGEYGLTTRSQAFTSGGRSLSNPIGRLNGSGANLYTVGAHIDSQSERPGSVAPGADDDGTGIVAAMEAARVLKSFEPCMKASVDFIGFNDEEEGMMGSETYANSMNRTTYKGLYNMDMVGYAEENGQCIKSYYRNASREQALAQRIADVNTRYNIGLLPVTVKQYNADDIDSSSFWSASLPATFQGECIDDDGTPDLPGYHTTDDTIEDVNFQMVTKTAKTIVAAIAELSQL